MGCRVPTAPVCRLHGLADQPVPLSPGQRELEPATVLVAVVLLSDCVGAVARAAVGVTELLQPARQQIDRPTPDPAARPERPR